MRSTIAARTPTARSAKEWCRTSIIICPWHQWEFDVTTGEYLDDPTICVDRFETKVEDGEVFVRVSGT